MKSIKHVIFLAGLAFSLTCGATSKPLDIGAEQLLKSQEVVTAADMTELSSEQIDKLKVDPWPNNVMKAFKYRQEYYRTFLGDKLELYSKITDDFPNVVTFWSHGESNWTSMQNTQLSVSDDFPSDDTTEAAYSLSVLQTRFEDQGFELISSHKLSDTDTASIGINKKALSEEELNRVVELVMQQRIPTDESKDSKSYATIAITLLPTIKNGKLAFTNVGIFYTEEQQKTLKKG